MADKIVIKFRQLIQEKAGNFTLTSALALPLLVVSAGGVVDFSQAFLERTRLQASLDAAMLSAVKKPEITSQREDAERFLT